MYGDSKSIKIAAVAAELNFALPRNITTYELMMCAKQLVEDFESLRLAYTEEKRLLLLN